LAAESATAAGARPVIGLSLPTIGYPVFDAGLHEAQQVAQSLDVELIVDTAQWNPIKQPLDIDNFVSRRVDGIVVWPMPFGSVTQSVEAAVKAGIPVANANTWANTDKVLVFVNDDEVESGRLLAKFMIDKLHNQGSIIELEGPPGFASDKKKAFEEVLGESHVKILASQNGGIDRQLALTAMASLMQKYPNFDGVMALNDEMMIGAINAMTIAHIDLTKKVTVSFDAIPEAIGLIKEGKLSASCDPLFGKQVGRALEYLIGYIRDKKMPPQKVILVKPELVTKESLPSG